MKSHAALWVLLLAVACGEPGDSDDTGGSSDGGSSVSSDGGSGQQDAGEQEQVDAGEPPANPNLGANGTWTLSGTDAIGCGMALSTGFTGVAVDGTTHEFRLTLKSTFNQQNVRLDCEFGATSKFTCEDYSVGMSFSGCQATGGLRDISGHINGTNVDIEGQVHSTGTGTCPPTVHCGPKNLLASGTVAQP